MKIPFYYKSLKEYLIITAGSVVTAIGVSLFLAPCHIASGGASGLAVIINGVFSVPVSVSVLLINLILFLSGFRLMKPKVMIRSFAGTIIVTIFIEVFSHYGVITEDLLLASVYGGALVGLGTGCVVSCNASTGGSDLTALLIKKVFPGFGVAKLIFFIDFGIALLSGAVFSDMTLLLYAVLSLFITSVAADFVINGFNFSKFVFIISNNETEIITYIINELKRGVTTFKARGGYSGEEKTVIMSAVSPNQFPALKTYIRKTDEKAFIILTDARSVFGEGFNIE